MSFVLMQSTPPVKETLNANWRVALYPYFMEQEEVSTLTTVPELDGSLGMMTCPCKGG